MNLRRKTITILILSVSVFFVISFLILYLVLFRAFAGIELERLTTNLTRTHNSIEEEYAKISLKLGDWATWDDTYKYVQKPNEAYLQSNLSNDALSILDIDFVVIASAGAKIIHMQYEDPNTHESKTPPLDLLSYFSENPQILTQEDLAGRKEGLISIGGNLVIISARPILRSSGEGPIAGVMMFGTYLTEEKLLALSDLTQNKIRIDPITSNFSFEKSGAVGIKNTNGFYKKNISKHTLEGYSTLKDISGKDIALMSITFERDIYKQARKVVFTSLGLIILMGFLMGIAGYFMLDRWIVRKIQKLSAFVDNIDFKNITEKRIAFKGKDEISVLAKNISQMLGRLYSFELKELETQKVLQRQLKEIEIQNDELVKAKEATLKLLDKQKIIQEELRREKANVEKKIKERTHDLEDKTLALKNAQDEISNGWLQLQEEKARLTASINSLPKGFIITDLKKGVITANIHVASILGPTEDPWTIEEIQKRLGKSLNIEALLEKAYKSVKPQKIEEFQLKDTFLRILILPIIRSYTNKCIGAVILIEDITEEKVLSRSKDEFFSIASHELRTPLTSIRGNTSLIQQYYPKLLKDKNLKEMITDIYDSSTRLIQIVNDFLDVSRIEQGRLEYKIEKVNLYDIVKSVVQELQANANEKSLALNFESKSEDKFVLADEDRVRQIVLNLVGNAIKYTEKGNIQVYMLKNKTHLVVQVSDSGRGIPMESRALLFRKFQQASNNLFTRDTTRGTGLGLYVARMLARGMRGDVDLVNSEEGKGSTFELSLPTT